MKLFHISYIRVLAILLFLTLPAVVSAADINVRGKVTRQGSGKPLDGVVIVDMATDRTLGTTNVYGEYSITVDGNATLLFEVLGCKDLQEPVKGRIELNVAMFPEAEMLQEVVVTGKSRFKGLVLPPADLILEGNEISLKTIVKIPHQLFSSSARMIIQPAIYDVNTCTLNYLKPVVFDGFRYNITQHRMLDWKSSNDPLDDYVQVKKSSRRTDDTVYIADKLRVENPRHDFMCVVMSSMEDYNNIIYSDTTRIARGTVNPMRFLSYSLDGVVMTDENYIPKPEVQLRDASGQVRLVFALGSPELDLSMGDNTAEMNKMLEEFSIIESDPDMTLKSFTIVGTASPEGSYAANRKLADRRMRSALDKIMASVPESIRRNARIIYDSDVAGWTDVEKLLRTDGLTAEADAVKAIIDDNKGNIDRQTRGMRTLPFYKTILLEQYLPRLRKVEYRIVSSRYRPLNNSEIAELYEKDYKTLSRYHFWKHYSETADTVKRLEIMRRALEVYPEFITAANDLTALTIDCNCADDAILKPFLPDMKQLKTFPVEARYNLAVASMECNHFSYADSLLYDMPDEPRFHKAKMYCAALNGRYSSVLQEIAAESPFNEVLMLLALHNNSRAYEKSRQLGESAEEEYIKAIAANRMADADAANGNYYLEAGTHLANAIHKKPELIDIARIDGDIIDLLDDDGNLPDDDYEFNTIE